MLWKLLSASTLHPHCRSTVNTWLHTVDHSKDATQAEMYDHCHTVLRPSCCKVAET